MVQRYIKQFKLSIGALLVAVSVVGSSLFAYSPAVSAQSGNGGGGDCGGASILLLPPWYKGLCDADGNIKSPGQDLGKFIWTIALNIIEMLLYIIGYVSLGFVIWGGFKYIISGDDANGVAGAKKTILNALIGLVLSIMSVGIVNVITGIV